MIVAAFLTALGVFTVAVLTQRYGYRLGGTVTIGIVAVYSLENVIMLPIFVLSTALAFLGLGVLRDRSLIYGRGELIAAIVIGSILPLAMLYTLAIVAGQRLGAILFIGSILPGLAAFNYHQLRPEQRRMDALVTGGVLVGLLAIGYALITPANAARFGELTPPVLFSQTADVAVYNGAVVSTGPEPALVPNRLGALVLLTGMVITESVREWFGLRIGIVSLALLALYSIASVWLLVSFAIVLVLTFLIIEVVHRSTLLYGRVLIGIGVAAGVLIVLPLSAGLPVVRGLSALFVGIIGGIGAYNLHVTPSGYRRAHVTLSIAVLAPLAGLAVLVGRPQPLALFQSLDAATIAILGVLTIVPLAVTWWIVPSLPDDESMFAASILNDGDGA